MAQTKIKAGLFEGIIGNGADGYFLMSNGDGTMTWSSIIINPTITSIAYPGSVTAADPAGGETITVTGTGFKTGATVTIGGTAAPAVSYVSETQITFTTPAKAAGDYDIVVTNTDTGSATYINGISYNGIPTWTTAAGSLGTFASDTTISTITLQATEPDAGTITFSITNGALPTGLSLTGANIDGTTTLETADTLYTFTVTATDDESQATPRTFTITVTKQFIGTENFTINTYTGNGSTLAVEGKIGTAADFNGSSSTILTTSDFANLDTFTVSAFVNFQVVSGTATIAGTNYKTGGASGDTGWLFRLVSGNKLNLGRYIGSWVNVEVDWTPSANTWYHVAATRTSTETNFYVNGSQQGTTQTGGQGSINYASDAKFTIGVYKYANVNYEVFNGKIDQVRFFNKVLSSSEVTTLSGENNASATKSTTDIFDDGSGLALYEFEEGAKDTGGVSGYIGAGGIFNGSSSVINIDNNSFNFTTVSVSFWLNLNSISGEDYVLDVYDDTSSARGYAISTDTSNKIKFRAWQSPSSFAEVLSSSTLSLNTWYHITMVATQSSASIYINGSLDNSGSLSGFNFYTQQSTSIGAIRTSSSSAAVNFLDGKLDQLRIFNKELSSSEVTTLYGETSASSTKSTTDIFDDGSGVALYELEGNANDTGKGTIDSGQSAVFNGSTSDVRIPTGAASTGGDLTISMWLNPNSLGTQILADWGWASSGNGLQILFSGTGYTFRVKEGATTTVLQQPATVPTTNTWQHITAIWRNSAGGLCEFYINGTQVTNVNSTQSGALTLNTTVPYYIGNYGTSGEILDGKLDDFRIYSSALSSTDVAYIANNDTANIPTSNLRAHYKFDGNGNDETTNYNATTVNNITYSDPVEFPTYDGTATNVSYAYDGTPTNVSFVGTSFQPDFVWLKSRTQNDNHYLQDVVRGATRRIHSNLTVAEQSPDANRFTSFDSNGFTVGGDNSVNMTGHDYVAWCWKAGGTAVSNTEGSITSSVSANPDAGFSIVKFTGNNASSATIGHGLSSAPEMIIQKRLDNTSNWAVYHSALGPTKAMFLNLTDTPATSAGFWNNTAPTSTVMSIENLPVSPYIHYCFHSVDGYQKIGGYTGTGSAGNTITTGFQPRFVMIKSSSSAEPWFILDSARDASNPRDNRLMADSSAAEADGSVHTVNFTSTGFTANSTVGNGTNGNGVTYIYLAIA